MQTSDWQVTERGFTLKNALPVITSEPVPTVKVQTSTKVSIINNVNDAETDLDQLRSQAAVLTSLLGTLLQKKLKSTLRTLDMSQANRPHQELKLQ